MFDDPFSTSTGLVNIQDYLGELLLVTPHSKISKKTKFKPNGQDTVVADFVVLTGPDTGLEHEQVNIFNTPLVATLERRIGRERSMLLARLAQADNPTNPDKPMWVFSAPSDEDKAIARKYLTELAERTKRGDTEDDPFKI